MEFSPETWVRRTVEAAVSFALKGKVASRSKESSMGWKKTLKRAYMTKPRKIEDAVSLRTDFRNSVKTVEERKEEEERKAGLNFLLLDRSSMASRARR